MRTCNVTGPTSNGLCWWLLNLALTARGVVARVDDRVRMIGQAAAGEACTERDLVAIEDASCNRTVTSRRRRDTSSRDMPVQLMTDCAETDSSDCVVGACDSENVKPSSSDAMNDVGLTLSVSVSASCEPSSLNTNTAVPCCALLSVTPSAVNVLRTLADAHDAELTRDRLLPEPGNAQCYHHRNFLRVQALVTTEQPAFQPA